LCACVLVCVTGVGWSHMTFVLGIDLVLMCHTGRSSWIKASYL